MIEELRDVAWPLARLGEAIEALGRAAELSPTARALEIPTAPTTMGEGAPLGRWIETMAAWLSLEAEPIDIPYSEAERFVRRSAPALLDLGPGANARFIAILRGGARSVTVLDGARIPRKIPTLALVTLLRRPLEDRVAEPLDRMLERTVASDRRPRARAALLRERLGGTAIGGAWLLRSPPGASLPHLVRQAKLPLLLGLMIGAHAVEYGLTLLSWWAVAKGALEGRFDTGWLVAWLLLLASLVPFRLASTWAASRLAIGAGTLLKTRLLKGALELDPNEIRHQGSGQLLSRVIESSAVETLGLTGGLTSLVAVVELFFAFFVLGAGSLGPLHVVLLFLALTATIVTGWHYVRLRQTWTSVRLSMTHDLVERMVGHRTRLAQEPRHLWHEGEDQRLDHYLVASQKLDRASIALSLLPQGWLLVGIAALAPGLMQGTPSTTALAITLGGILIAYSALQGLTSGVAQVAGAVIGWDEARPLLEASARVAPPPPVLASARTVTPAAGSVLLRAQDVRFRYRSGGEPVLAGCSMTIHVGDRLLLEGPSGGGKSTLGALLTGLRVPQSGLLLLDGLDRHVLGAAGWRRKVIAAPQFHENHVRGNTLAFNLLMGRGWPPSTTDLAEADALCRELGLGPLLDRMPAGVQQVVGETGWQLSHGEKSRIYIARALLQNADLIVLDESFAALDPETLKMSLECVLRRARALLVIAHP